MPVAVNAGGAGLDNREISLRRCFSEGWEAFSKNIGLTIGSYLLFALLVLVASQIPLGYAFGTFPLTGGLYLVFLGLLKGLNPSFSTIFAGFGSVDHWARWLGVGWLLYLYKMLVFLACAIPGAVLVGSGIFALTCVHGVPAGVVLIILGCLLTLAAYLAIAVRWVFVFQAAAEGASAFEAIRISTELTEGLRCRLFWIVLALTLFDLAGLLFCCIGTIFTSPLTQCALCALYLDVKQMRAQQPADPPLLG
jgi:uncharacterized membrane protein